MGSVVRGIFGKGPSAKDSISNINAGGLKSTLGKGNTINLTSSPERKGLVGNIAKTFPERASFLESLASKVAPGVSGLRSARLAEIESARRSAVGDLRDNLQRRRVLGSSFAGDAIMRAEKEFARENERVAAESFLTELELSNQINQQMFEARRGEFQTFLDELNLQAEIATQLSSNATAQLGANARLRAELDADAAGGLGNLLGMMLAPATGGASLVSSSVGLF